GDADRARTPVANGVAERLLDDAIDRGRGDPVAELPDRRIDPQPPIDLGVAAAPEIDERLQRGGEAELGEAGRLQPAEDRAELPLHVADRVGDRVDALPYVGEPPLCGVRLDPRGVHLHGEEEGADLVVKVARDLAAFLLLEREKLLVE